MKKVILLSFLTVALVGSLSIFAQQDKSKRPSPPAKVSETTSKGVSITIDYSQPSVKGRTIGKDIAPFGKVWRTGANEATTFEINKDAKVEGKSLKAGKYSLYSIPGRDEVIVIFNKTWNQGGMVYSEAEDALRVKVKPSKAPVFTEKMTFAIDKSGKVLLMWGDWQVGFMVA
ncbi:MAG: DUF2911 domain-containing protein [Segetibacter sp.]